MRNVETFAISTLRIRTLRIAVGGQVDGYGSSTITTIDEASSPDR